MSHSNASPLGDQSPATEVVDGVVSGVGVAQSHLPGPLTIFGGLAIGDPQGPDRTDAALGGNGHRARTGLERATWKLK